MKYIILTTLISVLALHCKSTQRKQLSQNLEAQYNASPIDCNKPVPDSLTLAQQGEYELKCRYKKAKSQYYYDAFFELPTQWGEPKITSRNANGEVSPEFKREVYLRYGLVYDNNFPNDDLPIGMTKTDDEFFRVIFKENVFGKYGLRNLRNLKSSRRQKDDGLSVNCNMCHSAYVPGPNGKLAVAYGVSNVFFDFERLHRDLVSVMEMEVGALYERNPERNSMVNSADYFGVLASYARRNGGRIDHQEMGNLMYWPRNEPSYIDNYSEYPLDVYALDQAFIKTQPWINFRYKAKQDGRENDSDKLYVDGGFSGSPAGVTYRLAISLDESGKDLQQAIQEFDRVGPAYFKSLRAPVYPWIDSVDREKASRGFELYQAKCESCHGKVTTNEGGYFLDPANYNKEIKDIGTDPQRHKFFTSKTPLAAGKLRGQTDRSPPKRLSNDSTAKTVFNEGYIAPPLVGIWARAPYLHNGSVPNLFQLLSDPSRRMKKFGIRPAYDNDKNDNYDRENLGWKSTDLTEKSNEQVSAQTAEDPYLRVYNPEWIINHRTQKKEGPLKVQGLDNSGHDLSEISEGGPFSSGPKGDEERMELIEFLKLL